MRSVVVIASIAAVVMTAACTDTKQPPVAAGRTAADSAEQLFIGMRTILTTKGVQRADLTADTAFVREDQTKFDLRKPHVVFTTETGAPQGNMDAKKGVYSTR